MKSPLESPLESLFALLMVFSVFFPFLSSWGETSFLPSSFRATFTQRMLGALHGREKVSQGVFDYRRPGQARFEMKGEQNFVVVSNPQKTWYYRPPFMEGLEGEVKVSKTHESSISRFFDLLNRGLKSNPDYTAACGVKKGRARCTLAFSAPHQKKLRLHQAILTFLSRKKDFSSLKEVELIYTNKKKVFLSFSNIEEGKAFATAHFEFFPPPGTRFSP